MYSLDHAIERATCPARIVFCGAWRVTNFRTGSVSTFATRERAMAAYNALVSDWLAARRGKA